MPYSNNGGPWGGGGGKKGGNGDGSKGPWGSGDRGNRGGGGGPGGQGPQVPDIDEIVRKGQEQLKILMGGGRGGGARGGSGGGGSGGFNRRTLGILAVATVVVWLMMSFYSVRPEEQLGGTVPSANSTATASASRA
jgi:modulator of FtsH protease HflK